MNVVITGASRGLGKAMAEIFAREGNNLFITSRNSEFLETTAANFRTRFPEIKVEAMAFDLSIPQQAEGFAAWVNDKTSPVDVLINNAGQFLPGSVYNEPDGILEEMIRVNLYSAYHVTRGIIPGMIRNKSGHVFNICSIASLQAYANGGSYSISKYALAGFSRNLREEMKPFGIKVTAVYPGAAYTDSWAASDIDPERLMEAEDIARMVFASSMLSPRACVEDIVVRPQLGDL